MKSARRLAISIALVFLSTHAWACTEPVSVCTKAAKTSFALIQDGQPATLVIDSAANSAVKYAGANFAKDLERVSGKAPVQTSNFATAGREIVIAGVLGESGAIQLLQSSGKLDLTDLRGQWEAYRQFVVDNPFPGVPRALVIVGSDRRGAVYGLYDISQKIGVSPWHWFADVPVAPRSNLYITAGTRHDQPKVRYRGFFINDEAPAFTTWAAKYFGGANSKLYVHVFELLLRMKGNYLWPAMWQPRAFNDDDPQNMVLADAMGVVMGTSHHEPMTRAHAEWRRNTEQGVTGGRWNFNTNGENLRKFWRGGMERVMSKRRGETPAMSEGYEVVVTVGMRGDGDEAMSEDTAIPVLESIVAAQRDIIRDVTGRPAEKTPQIWALYKEVQDYYDHGMKVPDDITLLFADDNWGQVRRLPTGDLNRKGGYGVYYHFDYVGGPRNYKWLNTNQIEKTWQQMDLSYQRGARQLWIVNVGDIKPMEFPLSFFMDHAWDPEAMTLEAMTSYPERWAGAAFGARFAKDIGGLVTRYSQLAAMRKPELLDAKSYPLGPENPEKLDGGEFGEIVGRFRALKAEVASVGRRLPETHQDAYYQIVAHPILALANLYEMYYAVAWNHRLAAAKDGRADQFADEATRAFQHDQEITDRYHAINDGKWYGMMSQTHIGYTTWQQPERQVMPELKVLSPAEFRKVEFVKRTAWAAGDVVIDATRFTRAHNRGGLINLDWRAIPHLGTGAGAVTAFPQGKPATTQEDAVHLEYDVRIPLAKATGRTVELHLSPTLNTSGGAEVRIGVSVDDGAMQTLALRLTPSPDPGKTPEQRNWEQAVIDNNFVLAADFPGLGEGKHTIKVWRLDDNVLLTRIVVR